MPGSGRAQRVAQAIHASGTDGLSVSQVAAACDLKPYDAKQVCQQLHREGLATLLSIRKNASTNFKVEQVYACRCPSDHRPPEQRVTEWRPLTETQRQTGLAGVAAARDALKAAKPRRRGK